jgi:MoaA/NifB/PqqE/SkfB family radical SAM enzyme
MKLDNIGFYTMSDYRVMQVSETSPIWRAEIILSDVCNFKCPYCRGLRQDCKGTIEFDKVKFVLDTWMKDGLKNVRFSGGEPTIYPYLIDLVKYCKENKVERIAISSNGSASTNLYQELIDAGANDFSISLDACCASFADAMAGVSGKFQIISDNIKYLAARTYTTVGVVLTEQNVDEVKNIIEYAHNLGVADIRIISAAQYNKLLAGVVNISENILNDHPILKYRVNNIKNGINVRGLNENDANRCYLAFDDSIVAGNLYHFPCVIYMREQGEPIGKVSKNMRQERIKWAKEHNILKDKICKSQCLDVCREYNNKYKEIHSC